MGSFLGGLAIAVFIWAISDFFNKNPGSLKRVMILVVLITTYFTVTHAWSQPKVSVWDLIVAFAWPAGAVLFLADLLKWVKTGKIM